VLQFVVHSRALVLVGLIRADEIIGFPVISVQVPRLGPVDCGVGLLLNMLHMLAGRLNETLQPKIEYDAALSHTVRSILTDVSVMQIQ
jgi:hypothetical protein